MTIVNSSLNATLSNDNPGDYIILVPLAVLAMVLLSFCYALCDDPD